MMKGGYFYERRTKQLSLFFIGVVFTTIVVWSWEKTPFLTTFLPSHSQVMQLFPAGEVTVKQVTQSKDDFKESDLVANLAYPVSSINAPSILGQEGLVDLVSPSSPINTPSLNNHGSEFSRTPQENHHENATKTVEKPVSSKEFKTHSKSKPPKQQLNDPISPKKPDSENIGAPIANVEKQACNYGKGKWTIDNNRPLYSGFGCKQWLSGMWACRLTQRTDFGYEKLKWQPKDCKMDDFNALKFLKRMQDKTLAFIGDSLGRQQFQSLMCMLTGGEERYDVEDVGKEYGLVKARGSVRPDGWAYQFKPTNTTILYYWSASLCDLDLIDPGNRTTYFAMHLDKPPRFLKRFIGRFHVVVLNTGHHWNRGKINANKWIMYAGGTPVTNKKLLDIGSAKNLTIYSIVNWVNGELGKNPGLKVFFRSISPRHFFNGDWNTGGTCDKTTPGELEVLQEESSDLLASGAVKGTRVKLLDVTGLSEVREEGHISRYSVRGTSGMQDCLHWCLPGVPDTWNELLVAQI